ncbi:MAG: hypothetical protein K8F34_16200 [Candidatus Kuenenia stuttgartiensis]|uniref:hypothetical protein n=1 Tax=Candidatus Kuenenia TaxID=380738 RepID=UPI0012FDAD92|nr:MULTISPECIES: hypothetical protein [Kuenenia]MBE7547063.1 hypothetical protein [Planctomycetia bacterium]MBZ0193215.1 hypothetical protein [Candidatus Kuenenia stuttgartiensis]MCF6151734.1 hypothetical protein [Candidatus Kuenenia stuttgartiensis]MCZ7624167.1 hypothetical protein [Candidatus Kuenenia sp.]GJQ50786.1 MAG: hypothetical protein HKUEN01_31720 [Candidatus Kuenenia stuttgartiensis]
MSITVVYPMREEAVKGFLDLAKDDWSVVNELVVHSQLIRKEYDENIFYSQTNMILEYLHTPKSPLFSWG